jgi:hypothetical protein
MFLDIIRKTFEEGPLTTHLRDERIYRLGFDVRAHGLLQKVFDDPDLTFDVRNLLPKRRDD